LEKVFNDFGRLKRYKTRPFRINNFFNIWNLINVLRKITITKFFLFFLLSRKKPQKKFCKNEEKKRPKVDAMHYRTYFKIRKLHICPASFYAR